METKKSSDTVKEGKVMAIISYLLVIGTIIAYAMNSSKKNSFASFHIRQTIGLSLLYLVNYILITQIFHSNRWVVALVWLFIFVLWVIGLVGVIQNEEKEVPILGSHFQKWFRGIG